MEIHYDSRNFSKKISGTQIKKNIYIYIILTLLPLTHRDDENKIFFFKGRIKFR